MCSLMVVIKPEMERNRMEPIRAHVDFKTSLFPYLCSFYRFYVTCHCISLVQVAIQYTMTLPRDIYLTFLI